MLKSFWFFLYWYVRNSWNLLLQSQIEHYFRQTKESHGSWVGLRVAYFNFSNFQYFMLSFRLEKIPRLGTSAVCLFHLSLEEMIGGPTCMLVFLTGVVRYFQSRKVGINSFSEITHCFLVDKFWIFLHNFNILNWKKFKSGGALTSRELWLFHIINRECTWRNARFKTKLSGDFWKKILHVFYPVCLVTMGLKIWVWEAERAQKFFSTFSHFSCAAEFSAHIAQIFFISEKSEKSELSLRFQNESDFAHIQTRWSWN